MPHHIIITFKEPRVVGKRIRFFPKLRREGGPTRAQLVHGFIEWAGGIRSNPFDAASVPSQMSL
ncbi:MAG: hypothetical protein ACM3U2_22450 [Deltaproteobacteria bacterium]